MRIEGYQADLSKLPIRRGDKVVIPAGTTVHSMAPGKHSYITKRKQTVTVHTVMCGQSVSYNDALNDRHIRPLLEAKGFDFAPLEAARDANSMEYYRGFVPLTNPTITWAGPRGYWCDVDINDVLEANGLTSQQEAA